MADTYLTPEITGTAGADFPIHSRIKYDNTTQKWLLADAADVQDGTAARLGITDREFGIFLNNTPGLIRYIASGAIAVGVEVEGAAGGKIATKSTGKSLGKAMVAATADGDIVTVAPPPAGTT